jgi:tRNA (adenine57-N1/adenine58-N1)-methyltransferase
MTWTLHGTHAKEGDLVQLVGLSHKHFLVTLKAGAILQTHRGIMKHDDIIGQRFGSKLESHLGRPFFLLQPSIADLLSELPRATQIMYPKDVGFVLMTMGIGPGQYVLEAGTGSGGLTGILAYYVGSEGKVFTYERNESHLGKAKKNIRNLGLSDRVVFHEGDAENGFEERDVDAVFLDMPNPYDLIHHVKASLKFGGFFGSILPTVNQVSKLIIELRAYGFQYIQVVETFFRYYKPQPDRLRPVDRMVAHTGFLVFARNMVTEDFDSEEMKQDQGIFPAKGE